MINKGQLRPGKYMWEAKQRVELCKQEIKEKQMQGRRKAIS
jgi:hypothetical protein